MILVQRMAICSMGMEYAEKFLRIRSSEKDLKQLDSDSSTEEEEEVSEESDKDGGDAVSSGSAEYIKNLVVDKMESSMDTSFYLTPMEAGMGSEEMQEYSWNNR